LLEDIGAIKSAEKRHNTYQDFVTALVDQRFDDDVIGQEEDDDRDDDSPELVEVLSAIEKVNVPLVIADDQCSFRKLFMLFNQVLSDTMSGWQR
jgi:hypothetical protein